MYKHTLYSLRPFSPKRLFCKGRKGKETFYLGSKSKVTVSLGHLLHMLITWAQVTSNVSK